MWRAYYEHRFLKLFSLLLRLTKNFFGFSYLRSIPPAFYAAKAAIIFRRNKGKENDENMKSVLKNLSCLYEIIRKNSVEKFDHKQVAELELEWWLVDRYPERYQTSRSVALANAMAALFSIDPDNLTTYATARAEAMVLCDKIEGATTQLVDWGKVRVLLKVSYSELSKAVQ